MLGIRMVCLISLSFEELIVSKPQVLFVIIFYIDLASCWVLKRPGGYCLASFFVGSLVPRDLTFTGNPYQDDRVAGIREVMIIIFWMIMSHVLLMKSFLSFLEEKAPIVL